MKRTTVFTVLLVSLIQINRLGWGEGLPPVGQEPPRMPEASPQWQKPNPLKQDVNGDGRVDQADLEEIGKHFGAFEGRDSQPNPKSDVNKDGVVNVFDLVLVASHFGERNLWKILDFQKELPTLKNIVVEEKPIEQHEEVTSFFIDRAPVRFKDEIFTRNPDATFWKVGTFGSEIGKRIDKEYENGTRLVLGRVSGIDQEEIINGVALINKDNGEVALVHQVGAGIEEIPLDGKLHVIGKENEGNVGYLDRGIVFDTLSVSGSPDGKDIYIVRTNEHGDKVPEYQEVWHLSKESNKVLYFYGFTSAYYSEFISSPSYSGSQESFQHYVIVHEFELNSDQPPSTFRIDITWIGNGDEFTIEIKDISKEVRDGYGFTNPEKGKKITSGETYDTIMKTMQKFFIITNFSQ